MDCRWTLIIRPASTSLSEGELRSSLNSLFGWPEFVGPHETGLIEQCERACAVPIEELMLPDLHALLEQGVGLPILLQIAVPIVESTPWMEADCYPGDLLMALIGRDDEIAKIGRHWVDRLAPPVRCLLAIWHEERKYHDAHPEIWEGDYWAIDQIWEVERFLLKWVL